jgi:hypothetical protein
MNPAIDACLLFSLAEAKAFAIAEALISDRILNAEQIDTIIAAAPERTRRAD